VVWEPGAGDRPGYPMCYRRDARAEAKEIAMQEGLGSAAAALDTGPRIQQVQLRPCAGLGAYGPDLAAGVSASRPLGAGAP